MRFSNEKIAPTGKRPPKRGKSNEITAIPALLDLLNIEEKSMVSIEAMGRQKEIVTKIGEKKTDYVLMVKGNQPTFLEETTNLLSCKK